MLAIHLATMDKSLHDTTMGALQLHCGVLMEAERLKIEPATAVMFNLWLEERLHSALDAGNSGITMDEYGNVKVSLFLSESHRMCIGMLEFGQVKLMPMDDRAKLVAGKMVYCIEWLNEKLDKDNHHQEPVAERLFALASAIPALASSAHLNEKEAADFALNCLFVSRILHSVIGSKQFPWRLLDILALLERFQSAKTALSTETNGRGEQLVVWAIDEALSIIGRCTGYALNEN